MEPRALVMDADAAALLQSAVDPAGDWFGSFRVSDPSGRIRSSFADGVAIITSVNGSGISRRLLVIDLKEKNFFLDFPDDQRSEIFRRILVGAQSVISSAVNIPRAWRVFSSKNRVSFHALSPIIGKSIGKYASRVEMDRNAFGTGHVYVFNCSQGWSDLDTSVEDEKIFRRAVNAYEGTATEASVDAQDVSGAIFLNDESYFYSENNLSFEEWIDSRLTARQRQFVGAESGRSIRLQGAAGTGKTLALAIRVLVTMRECRDTGVGKRLLFLTHSASTCEAVEALMESLDRRGLRADFLGIPDARFKVCTLLDLALEVIGTDLEASGIYPLETDAIEGRKLQLELVEALLKEFLDSPEWRGVKNLVSDVFGEYMKFAADERTRRRIAWEFMNEFACVLDADGVLQKPQLRQRYLRETRQAWMLPLPGEIDRKVVLTLYDGFVRMLAQMNSISVDQITSDFLNYLDSFRWNAVREKKGYDDIFVDELHLFNRQERMVFHGLTRSPEAKAGIYLAYDSKQAPSDTFMPLEERDSERTVWTQLRVGRLDKVELDKVFRYSPEIAGFISKLDESYPALSLGEDWEGGRFESGAKAALVPTVCVLLDELETYKKVFVRAHELKRRGGQKFTVAVLCCNIDNFQTYKDAGEYKAYFRAVSSREEAAGAKPDAFRFVLSTPEYVAGLQFDAVFLLDINRSETPSGSYSAGLRRRFLSKIYLGASRAKSHLELYSSSSSGGICPVLDPSIASGTVTLVDWSALPSPSAIIQ